jgi:hypothetical protein
MKRTVKMVSLVLITAGAFLVWSGTMKLSNAILLVVALEALLALAGIGGVLLVVRRYRRGRKEGLDVWAALENGLALVLPGTVARLIVHEPKILASLFRWVFGRTKPSESEFSYYKRSPLRMIVPLVVLTAPIELFVVHLLAHLFVPWAWVKWVLLIVGVYAVFWLIAFYASIVTLPHRLEEGGIRIRYGAFTEGFVPYTKIADIKYTNQRATKFHDGLQAVPEEDALYLAVGSMTNIALRLHAPHSIYGLLKESAPASLIYLATDEPERFVRELRGRVESSAAEVINSSDGDTLQNKAIS